MTAPPEITIRSLTGKYTMNKTLSDSQDAFLTLQGISWFTRKAIQLATISLVINEYETEGVVHVDITSSASGLSTTQEDRVCNWTERDHNDKLFGNVKGKSRMIKQENFESALDGITKEEKEFLLAKRLKDGSQSAFLDDELLQSVAFNQDGLGWGVDQVWGFEQVDGERRYTRRLICKNKSKSQLIRLVYDYNGPVDA